MDSKELLNTILATLRSWVIPALRWFHHNETAAVIYEDTVNKYTYICFPDNYDSLRTVAEWRVTLIDESVAGVTDIKHTSLSAYTTIIDNGAGLAVTLTALRVAGAFHYHK
jgi:hypothetical protein